MQTGTNAKKTHNPRRQKKDEGPSCVIFFPSSFSVFSNAQQQQRGGALSHTQRESARVRERSLSQPKHKYQHEEFGPDPIGILAISRRQAGGVR